MFDPAYEGNPLVNAMCVGLLREEELMRAVAEGVGNPIIAVGARTGRDGIHGASFASEDLSAASEAKRPRVQVGDPFTEKLLLEAILELIRSGAHRRHPGHGRGGAHVVLAPRWRRAATSASTIDITKVPVREDGHDAVRDPAAQRVAGAHARRREAGPRGATCATILEKWDLTAAVIGEVIAEPVYRVTKAIGWSPSSRASGS